jgi:integrase
METGVVRAENRGAVAVWSEAAKDYASQAKSAATIRAYRAGWSDFTAWCAAHGQQALPATPATLASYLAGRAETLKPASLGLYAAAVSQAHQAAGYASPTRDAAVRAVMQGIRRAKGTAPEAKAPAITADIRRMVEHLPAGLLGIRDRALLLVGFAGAFRRSELVGLDREDVTECAEGLTITLRRSKTDQEGAGRKIGIPYGGNLATCPVRSLMAWLDAAGIEAGPLFVGMNRHGQLLPGRLSDRGVARVVQRHAEAAGLAAAKYGGHSLRAGLATSAAAAGASERKIMDQTGHRSAAMVRRYIREGSLFRENAAASVGL